MQLADYIGKPCNNQTAFEFVPKKKTTINMEKVIKKLEEKKTKFEIKTPFVIIFEFMEKKISFFKSGRILIKNDKNEETAKKIAQKLIKVVSE